MIFASVDKEKVTLNIKNIQSAVKSNLQKHLFEVGLELLRLSQKEVPHDEGTLQNSGTVEKIGNDLVVGYHTRYAAWLHEHPDFNFQDGRKGKYLEDPIIRNAQVLGLGMSGSVGKTIEGAIK